MRRLFYIVALLVALSACAGSTPEEAAAKAAKAYYDCLVEDFPEGFLEGKAGIDSLPDAYCEQLVQACHQYVADVIRKHGGLLEVRVSDNVGRTDESLGLTYAFLLLNYADSAQEEITGPMVEVNGEWKMK